MIPMHRRSLLALAVLPMPALAFPERSVNIIVPFAAGGSTDIAARLIAERLSALVAGRFVVENHPDLPTLEEQGVAPFDLSTWNALLAPRSTPPERVVALSSAIHAALAEPGLAQRLAGLGVGVPEPTGPAETAAFLSREVAKFRAIAEGAGLRLERP